MAFSTPAVMNHDIMMLLRGDKTVLPFDRFDRFSGKPHTTGQTFWLRATLLHLFQAVEFRPYCWEGVF